VLKSSRTRLRVPVAPTVDFRRLKSSVKSTN
jgi:hypothetical protein